MTVTVGAFEAKTHLSSLLQRVEAGEEVTDGSSVRVGGWASSSFLSSQGNRQPICPKPITTK